MAHDVGDLAGVTESTLVDDLAEPSRIVDTTWIRPGKAAWSWLSEHSSPSDLERQKAYVDFAARNGWPYVLVDEGWSDKWVPELMSIAGVKYSKGIGVHASSDVVLSLGGNCRAFIGSVGVDDETTSPGSVAFQVLGDDKVLQQTGVLRTGNPAVALNVDITGVQVLSFRVTDGGDGKNFDHADWALTSPVTRRDLRCSAAVWHPGRGCPG